MSLEMVRLLICACATCREDYSLSNLLSEITDWLEGLSRVVRKKKKRVRVVFPVV